MRFCLLALLVGCGSAAHGSSPSADGGTATVQPTVLATFDPIALNGSNLALDSEFLYFATSNAAMRVPLAGGEPEEIAAGLHGPLVLDANSVYGFDATGIVAAPKKGGPLVTVHGGSQLGQHLAVDTTYLYFHDYYGVRVNGDNYNQSIFQLELGTGTVVSLASKQYVTGPFASDDTDLYWFSDNAPGGDVSLVSMNKDGSAPTVLTSGGGTPDGPAFDGITLYWTTFGGWSSPPPPSMLSTLPATGGTPMLLASPDQPGDLAVDGSDVYFIVHDDTLLKLNKEGGMPTVLAPKLNRPRALVLDDSSVYWINAGDGTIVKLSK